MHPGLQYLSVEYMLDETLYAPRTTVSPCRIYVRWNPGCTQDYSIILPVEYMLDETLDAPRTTVSFFL